MFVGQITNVTLPSYNMYMYMCTVLLLVIYRFCLYTTTCISLHASYFFLSKYFFQWKNLTTPIIKSFPLSLTWPVTISPVIPPFTQQIKSINFQTRITQRTLLLFIKIAMQTHAAHSKLCTHSVFTYILYIYLDFTFYMCSTLALYNLLC